MSSGPWGRGRRGEGGREGDRRGKADGDAGEGWRSVRGAAGNACLSRVEFYGVEGKRVAMNKGNARGVVTEEAGEGMMKGRGEQRTYCRVIRAIIMLVSKGVTKGKANEAVRGGDTPHNTAK